MGNAHPTGVPYQAFPTADGYIILAVGNDGQFQRFCAAAGLEALAEDARYRTNAARIINRETLIPRIAEALRQRTSSDWIALLESKAVPCGPINTIDQVFEDPQVQARGMKRVLNHETAGPLAVVANPGRMASHNTTSAKAPPMLGESTDAVLSGVLGLSAGEIAALRAEGIV